MFFLPLARNAGGELAGRKIPARKLLPRKEATMRLTPEAESGDVT